MRPLDILLAPIWLAGVATTQKSFARNPVLGSPWLNRRGLHEARVALAQRMAERRRAALGNALPAAQRAAFDRDGFLQLPDFLGAERFAPLRAEVFGQPLPAVERLQGDAVTRHVALTPGVLARLPALAALLDDPRYVALTQYAATARIRPIHFLQTIMSRVCAAPEDPQTVLHSDTFHPAMKAWLFLTDVAPGEGCFTYVPGSHRATPQRLAWERERSIAARALDPLSRHGSLRVEAHELAALGYGPPRELAAQAGTLVVADTYGFHARGLATRPTTRVEVWAIGRRNPFLPWTGLDPWSLPGLRDRRAVLRRAGLEVLIRAGLAKRLWQEVGAVAVDAPPRVSLPVTTPGR
jgi:hypothetical protein